MMDLTGVLIGIGALSALLLILMAYSFDRRILGRARRSYGRPSDGGPAVWYLAPGSDGGAGAGASHCSSDGGGGAGCDGGGGS